MHSIVEPRKIAIERALKSSWPHQLVPPVTDFPAAMREIESPIRDGTSRPTTCVMMERIEFGLEIQTGSANLGDHSQRLPNRVSGNFEIFVGQVGQVDDHNLKKP